MNELPQSARIFIRVIYALGMVAVGAAFWHGLVEARQHPLWEAALFALVSVFAGSAKIKLMRFKRREDVGSMSLGFAIIFAAMLRFGPAGATLVGIASTLASCLYQRGEARKRQPWYQVLFNVAVNIVATVLASFVFLVANKGRVGGISAQTLSPVIASTFTFFFCNTGAVATVIALCSNQKVWKVWRGSFVWTGPSYFLGAAVSSLAVALLGQYLTISLIPISVVAYMTYLWYKDNMERTEALLKSKEDLATLYLRTISSLALAIDAKDRYTHQHIVRVQRYAVATAQKMGLEGDDLQAIQFGALLHDIGKLGVPEYVLLKPGRLTEEEFAKIKEHPRIGADILDPVEFPWPVLPAVKYHHERWDGSGYPEGLVGEAIPLQGRILAVADVYDALTSSRSYRNAWTHEKAINVIREGSGSHFDPVVADAFLAIIDGVVQEMAVEGTGPLASVSAAASMASETAAAAGVTTGNNGETTSLAPLVADGSRAANAARDIYRASAELWALYEVAQTLSSSLGLQETLDILARKLAALMPGTGCVFLIRSDDDESVLLARAAVGVDSPFFDGSRTGSKDSLSLQMMRERTTYRGIFDPEDLVPNSIQTVPWIDLGSVMIVPIIHQEEELGTINLYHTDSEAFGPHDQHLLEMIAERAALALYNGLLYDRTRSHALTDPLTGLANLRFLTNWVTERCNDSQSAKQIPPFALLCLDLDSFKPINDNFGHQRGDLVLRDLARILRSTVRAQDFVVRYGGDEFLIILDGARPVDADEMAHRLQDAVAAYDPCLVHPRVGPLRLGASVGYASFPFDGVDATTLLAVADQRMYHDKTERKLGRLASESGTLMTSTAPPRLVLLQGADDALMNTEGLLAAAEDGRTAAA